jgi:hypothetical protein
MLHAERSALRLLDPQTGELFDQLLVRGRHHPTQIYTNARHQQLNDLAFELQLIRLLDLLEPLT